MSRMRAQVRHGRLILDQPSPLPEGTVLDLVVDDEGDDLDAAERAQRDDALRAGIADARAGRVRDAAAVIEKLRRR